MEHNLTGKFSDKKVTVDLEELGTINYYFEKPNKTNDRAIYVMLQDGKLVEISLANLKSPKGVTGYIEIVAPDSINVSELFYFLVVEMKNNGYELNVNYEVEVSDESLSACKKYWQGILPILRSFGFHVNKPRKAAAKPRHKYLASLAQTPLTIDYQGSEATVYWIKRDQFVIKKGAKLIAEAPLTKAGIIGFAGKFGLQLRSEHAEQIQNNTLIADVTLRSVNEVGTFLYFAGTNSWQQLKTPDGKTLDELTVVK